MDVGGGVVAAPFKTNGKKTYAVKGVVCDIVYLGSVVDISPRAARMVWAVAGAAGRTLHPANENKRATKNGVENRIIRRIYQSPENNRIVLSN